MLKIHFSTHLMRLSVDNVDKYWFEIWPAVSSAWCDFSFLHAQLTTQITIANIRRVVEIQKKFKTKRTKTIFIFCLRDASFYFDVRGTSQTIVVPVEEKGNCVLLKSFNIRVISRLTNLCIYIEYMCTVEVPSQTMMGYVWLAQLPLYNLRKYRKTQKYPFGQSIVCFCERTFITATKSFVPATEYTCENDSSMLENVGKRRMNAVSFEYRYI